MSHLDYRTNQVMAVPLSLMYLDDGVNMTKSHHLAAGQNIISQNISKVERNRQYKFTLKKKVIQINHADTGTANHLPLSSILC